MRNILEFAALLFIRVNTKFSQFLYLILRFPRYTPYYKRILTFIFRNDALHVYLPAQIETKLTINDGK